MMSDRAERWRILSRFGSKVRERRLDMALSQEELAHRCGLDRTYVSGVERGARNISLVNIYLMADALETSVSELTKDVTT